MNLRTQSNSCFLSPCSKLEDTYPTTQTGSQTKVYLLIWQVSLKWWHFIYFLTSAQTRHQTTWGRMASLMKCNFLKVQMSAVSPLSPLCLCANRHCSSEHRASGPFSIIVSSNVSLPWSTSIQLSCCPFHSNKSSCYKVIDWFSCRQMGLSTSAPPPRGICLCMGWLCLSRG